MRSPITFLVEISHTVGLVTLNVWKVFGVFLKYWCEGLMDPWTVPCTWGPQLKCSVFRNIHPCILHIHIDHLQQQFHYYSWALGNWINKESNAIFAIIKELQVHELKWHINRFESRVVPGYEVKKIKKVSDPAYDTSILTLFSVVLIEIFVIRCILIRLCVLNRC